jgi:isopentenyl-diphosphate delta-isomerase
MDEQVVLVDEHDQTIGSLEKMAAHREPLLHRAFSIFVFSSSGLLLLQRRAAGKYHSAGLWSNTCCGHPRPGEGTVDAARRRLVEEMGIDCALVAASTFVYRAELGGGLIEHEFDHVFLGVHDGPPRPAPIEVSAWRWIDAGSLQQELRIRPLSFTAWFPPALDHVRGWLVRSSLADFSRAREVWRRAGAD